MKDYLKITITAIISTLMTFLILSFTVINSKASIEYVDKQDEDIKTEIEKVESDYQRECQKIKADYQRETNQINVTLNDMQKDIKVILEKL